MHNSAVYEITTMFSFSNFFMLLLGFFSLAPFLIFFEFNNVLQSTSPPPERTVESSSKLLLNFVEDKIENMSIDNIKFDNFSLYGTATCISANSSNTMAYLLSQELQMIPQSALNQLIGQTSNFCINKEKRYSMESSEEVTYIYWNSDCNKEKSILNLCVSIAGAKVKLSEIITGTIIQRENTLIGYEPCHCSILNAVCRECPIIKKTEKVKEIKKRPQLSLEQHVLLTNALHSKAVSHAKQLIASEDYYPRITKYTHEPSNV